jgi:hypothetical protein
MRLRARDLRSIADGLEQLAKMNIAISEFRTSEGHVCTVEKRAAADQRDVTEYFLIAVAEPISSRDY